MSPRPNLKRGLRKVFIRGSSRLRYVIGMRNRGFLAIVLTLLALSTPSAAQWRHPPYYGGGVQRLDRILPGIRSARPGRFYDAEGPYRDATGGMHYRIKWLTPEGRVMWLDTDARTGRVIGPAGTPAEIPGRPRPEGPPGDGRFGPMTGGPGMGPPGDRRFGPMPGGPGMGRGIRPGGWGRPGYGGWRGVRP